MSSIQGIVSITPSDWCNCSSLYAKELANHRLVPCTQAPPSFSAPQAAHPLAADSSWRGFGPNTSEAVLLLLKCDPRVQLRAVAVAGPLGGSGQHPPRCSRRLL